MKSEREREGQRGRGVREDKRAKDGELESGARGESVSMTTMWGSGLFVCGLKQTSDC